jgi:SagB-type dehydrogenase family enzyme
VSWISLGNPRPRPEPQQYAPVQWTESDLLGFQELGLPCMSLKTASPEASFAELISRRRTRYELGIPPGQAVEDLLRLTCQVQVQLDGPHGFRLSNRPVPSAGGIHPIHVVLHAPGSNQVHRYDPFQHGLRKIESTLDTQKLRSAMYEVVPADQAVLLLLVAEPGMTAAKYADASSLIWRDAGVLLAGLIFAAEALGLNFVPLGVTGDPWAGQLVSQPGLYGVGAALIGFSS